MKETGHVITAAQLQARLGDEHLVLFDCRFALTAPSQGYASYLAAHIPGAWYLDLEADLSGPAAAHGGRHPLPDAEALAEKLSIAGVDADAQVVVYDDGGGMAPRAWWLLRYLGHPRVAVLDGGWSGWRAFGGTQTAELPERNPKRFPLDIQTDWVVAVPDVRRIASGETSGLLLDARAAARYRGDVEPIDPKAGHIPGAVNAPWEENLNADGTWKSTEALRARFAPVVRQAGDDAAVVAYCGSGVTACANLFALTLAGYPRARLYAGSWSDWCSYDDHPIATDTKSR